MLMATPEPAQAEPAKPAVSDKAYEPSYFTAEEWAFINAAVERLIPADAQGRVPWRLARRNTSTAR